MARKRNYSTTTKTVGVVAALLLGGYAVKRWMDRPSTGDTGGGVPKPPAVPPGEEIEPIAYQDGGETAMTLPAGASFTVTYDETIPWKVVAQGTNAVPVLEEGDGAVTFEVAQQLPTGTVEQVYVITTDLAGNVLGEHKITIHGP